MRRKSLVIALLLILVGAMAIVPVMADPNVFSQAHMRFERAWTRYSICIRLMGIVPVIPTQEITFTTFTFYSIPNATQPVPGNDYVYLITGADDNILYVENQPGLGNFTAALPPESSSNPYIGYGTTTLVYVINLSSEIGVVTFTKTTWTFDGTSGLPVSGTFKGSYFATMTRTPPTGFTPHPYPTANTGSFNMTAITGVFHGPNGETLLAYGSRLTPPGYFVWKCTLITP